MEICNRNIKIALLFLVLIFLIFNVKAEIGVTKEKGIKIHYSLISWFQANQFYSFCAELEKKYRGKNISCEDGSIVVYSVLDEGILRSIENDEELKYYKVTDLKDLTNFIRKVVNPILRDELVENVAITLTEKYEIKDGKIEVANKKEENIESGFDYLFKSEIRLKGGEISFDSSETKIEVYPEGQVKIEDVFIKNINEKEDLTIVLKKNLLKERVREKKIKGKIGDKFVIKSIKIKPYWSEGEYKFREYKFVVELGEEKDIEIKKDEFCIRGLFKLTVYKKESLEEKYKRIQELDLSGRRCVNLLDGKISSLFLIGDKYYAENEMIFFEDNILYNIGLLLKEYTLYPMEKGLIITEREVKSESGRVRIVKDKKEIKIT